MFVSCAAGFLLPSLSLSHCARCILCEEMETALRELERAEAQAKPRAGREGGREGPAPPCWFGVLGFGRVCLCVCCFGVVWPDWVWFWLWLFEVVHAARRLKPDQMMMPGLG